MKTENIENVYKVNFIKLARELTCHIIAKILTLALFLVR